MLAALNYDLNCIKQGTIKELMRILPEILTLSLGNQIFSKEFDGVYISRIFAYRCDYRQDIKILYGPSG